MKNHLFKITWLTLIMALTLSLFVPYTAVLASNTSQASYYAVIRVSNNGTSTAYNVSVPLTFNTSYMINGDYFVSNLSNTAMIDNNGDNGYYNPAVVTNKTWMIFVPFIPADSSIDFTFYMGGNLNMSGNKSWFSGTAGGTTANSTSLHLGSNFSIIQSGYINTDYYNNKNLTAKTGSLVCNITSDGVVNVTAYDVGSLNLTLASGMHTIEIFHEPTTFGFRADYTAETVNCSDVNQDGLVNSTDVALVTHYILFPGAPGDPDYLTFLRCDVNLSGNVTVADQTLVAGNYKRLKYDLNMDGLTDQDDVTYLQSYILTSTPASLLIAADYNGNGAVTGADVTLLEAHVYITMATSDNLLDTAADWKFATNNTWRYLERQTIKVNGVTVQDISWQNAAIWVDASGYGNNLTPTFRTTTTNANVSAVLYDLQTDHEAILTDWDLNNYTNDLDIPDMPGGMYDATPTFPGTGVVNDISDAGGYPRSTLWFILPTILIVAAGLLIHDKTKSLFAQALITCLAVVFLSLIHVWAFWLIIPIGLISMAACLAGKVLNY